MPLVLKLLGNRKFCVNSILEIHGILNMPQVLGIPRFCMYQESSYAGMSQGMLEGFLYTSGFDYARVLILFWRQP